MNARKYWMSEISNRAKSTRERYATFFDMFCEWLGKTPDEMIEERKADEKKDDMREKRRYESELKRFMVYLEEEKGYSIASRQVAWASVKSFFDTHYYPLVTRNGDYPRGESLGFRGFTRDELRTLTNHTKMSLRSKTIVFLLKDSGLRVGDLVRLKYGDIADEFEKGEDFIAIKIVTQKSKIVAKTFFGQESVELLRKYIAYRLKGTRRIPPEVITAESPLIRNSTSKMTPMSRSGISSLVSMYVKKAGLPKELSAHSLRKYCQTQLEAAGVHGNWVQQILGHRLVNSEGSYSRPTDEMLKNAYEKAYDSLRVFPRTVTTDDLKDLQEENKALKEEIGRLQVRQDQINGDREKMYQEFMKRLKKELRIE